jgi:hypothetical protein
LSPRQVMWDLWWTNQHWVRFSRSSSVFAANYCTDCSTLIIHHPGLAQQASSELGSSASDGPLLPTDVIRSDEGLAGCIEMHVHTCAGLRVKYLLNKVVATPVQTGRVDAPTLSRQLAHSLTRRPLFTPGRFLVLISVRR